MQRPFRFLHAADLHLDRPCRTFAELPDQLRDLAIEAPLLAATKVFDAALNQRVDFVVLAGDVINPQQASPRELLFLVEQFKRLAERNISVYWAGGEVDSLENWPSYVQWPANVHRFSQSHVQRFRYEIAGASVCEIVGRNHNASQLLRPYEIAPSSADLFSIAVVHAQWNASALGEIGIDYWALGGSHHRSTPLESNCVAHFAGTPQSRSAGEPGSHGCTIVSVDDQCRIQLAPIQCDVLRWITPQFAFPPATPDSELARLLEDRTEQLAADSGGVPLMISWEIACQGSLQFALRHGSLGTELTTKLRQLFANRQTPVWTLAIEAELSEQLPTQWQTEPTLRGDYTRAILGSENLEGDSDLAPLHLTLPESLAELLQGEAQPLAMAGATSELTPSIDAAEFRTRLMGEVAWLGAELLSPPEAAP